MLLRGRSTTLNKSEISSEWVVKGEMHAKMMDKGKEILVGHRFFKNYKSSHPIEEIENILCINDSSRRHTLVQRRSRTVVFLRVMTAENLLRQCNGGEIFMR